MAKTFISETMRDRPMVTVRLSLGLKLKYNAMLGLIVNIANSLFVSIVNNAAIIHSCTVLRR